MMLSRGSRVDRSPTGQQPWMAGDVDMLRAMRLFKEVGYDGPSVYDHVPEMLGDSERQEQAVAFALGYIKGLMKAVGVDG